MTRHKLKDVVSTDLRFKAGRWLLHSRHVRRPYLALRPAFKDYRVRRASSVVVDGFPRSANTYAWNILRAIGGGVHVAGHTHSPQSLIEAVRLEIPAILILREPDDAVASYAQLAGVASLAPVFRAYVNFHVPLIGSLDRLLVADFSSVTSDFGSVVRALNRRFGTDFPQYDRTEENERLIRERIEDAVRARWNGELREAGVARPSRARRPTSEVLRNMTVRDRQAREMAWEVYRRVEPAVGMFKE